MKFKIETDIEVIKQFIPKVKYVIFLSEKGEAKVVVLGKFSKPESIIERMKQVS